MRHKSDEGGVDRNEKERLRSEKRALRMEKKRKKAVAKDERALARRRRNRQRWEKIQAWCEKRINRMVPPGFEWMPLVNWSVAGMGVCAVISMFRFGKRYGYAWRAIEWVSELIKEEQVYVERPIGVPMGESPWFFWTGRTTGSWQTISEWNTFIKEGEIFSSFSWLMEGVMAPFVYLMAIILLMTILHYLYYYHESKSIYLMKRLPRRSEIHRRCFALPLTLVAVCVMVTLLLSVIYFGWYYLWVPGRCIEPGQLSRFLREGIFNMWRGD